MMSPAGIQRLKDDEGYRAEPYTDTLGHLTIGYGTLLKHWDEPFAADVLRLRLDAMAAQFSARWPCIRRLDEVRRDAILNMVYQLGVNGVLGFRKTLRLLEDGSHMRAAREVLDSKWARQTPNRAKRIAYMIEHGEYPSE